MIYKLLILFDSLVKLVQKMSEKVDFNDDELPQERYEGVDPDEWVSLFNLIYIILYFIV